MLSKAHIVHVLFCCMQRPQQDVAAWGEACDWLSTYIRSHHGGGAAAGAQAVQATGPGGGQPGPLQPPHGAPGGGAGTSAAAGGAAAATAAASSSPLQIISPGAGPERIVPILLDLLLSSHQQQAQGVQALATQLQAERRARAAVAAERDTVSRMLRPPLSLAAMREQRVCTACLRVFGSAAGMQQHQRDTGHQPVVGLAGIAGSPEPLEVLGFDEI